MISILFLNAYNCNEHHPEVNMINYLQIYQDFYFSWKWCDIDPCDEDPLLRKQWSDTTHNYTTIGVIIGSFC